METFLAALGGALVGGFASTVGALIVAKKTQTRNYRARIYDEPLADLIRSISWPTDREDVYPEREIRRKVEAIRTAGHVIGGTDTTKVDALYTIYDEWDRMDPKNLVPDGSGGMTRIEGNPPSYTAQRDLFFDAVDDYQNWIRDRLAKRL